MEVSFRRGGCRGCSLPGKKFTEENDAFRDAVFLFCTLRLKGRLFRKVRTDPDFDLAAECTEETRTHTEKTRTHTEKKEEKGHSERALTRISRKTRKEANEFLKIQKICSSSLFFTAFCVKIRVSLCVFSVFSGETGTQFPDGPFFLLFFSCILLFLDLLRS